MSDYHRYRVSGGCYFFTVNLYDRHKSLLIENLDLLRESVRSCKQKRPFHIDAWVVLPEHMHCIWTLPEGDVDFSNRWKMIKTQFSKGVAKGEKRSFAQVKRGERGIWQRRYWEHLIRDEVDYKNHMDYLHFNPVKHGWVERAIDWQYSSFHRCISQGIYPENWASDNLTFEAGERIS
ncbi:MAG: transposase [Methyloprofundus sp.]|nr:transposase [Methyloprofundus sp.]